MASRIPAQEEIRAIVSHFPLHGELREFRPQTSGHIHDSLVVTFDQGGMEVRYLLQRINHHVFTDVPLLMENIRQVTQHMARRARGDNRRVLTLVPALNGQAFHQTPEGDFWRVYVFIERARTHDELETTEQAFEAARAFGGFQRAFADFPADRIKETIAGFHDTRQRFERLRQAAAEDRAGRKSEVAAELDFAFRREAMVGQLLDLAATGALPMRVTHNDTKINNVLLDEATGEGICVIDLDTVMPGFSLYDFGDMVRTAASPAAEDERDLSKIVVRKEFFEAIARGFTEGVSGMLVDAEWENLVFSGKLMTFEVGIRFLTDYLEGDTYFKTSRPGHNLDRCRTQFRLVECLEENEKELEAIVRKLRRNA